MNQQQFNHGLLRKYAAVFGSLFNNIYIRRNAIGDEPEQLVKVPLRYAPKGKDYVRNEENPDANRNYATLLPRIGFEQENLSYDPGRQLPSINRTSYVDASDPNSLLYTYTPVPYNIDFSVYIMSKNAKDGNQILEQILPFFTPQWNLSVNIIPEMDITRDISVVFKGNVEKIDTYDGAFMDRRILVYTLGFTMKAWLYGATRKAKIVKFADAIFHGVSTNTSFEDAIANTEHYAYEMTRVTPGLTANGEPTENPDNSVDVDTILVTDDFGYAWDITEIEDE